ncbi:hypothetical protein TVAG_013610 [Trichomonas vaginalis G3]|uniref:DUF3447 domain-containing protein n=1 Tax=Trichomonas vaginalis (strain ATCC PRA-98 / G3) TaxID=412133 RepID=A2DDB7_TRIV3|nr:spectrin binding [Trichomonas vaginalis G3]EAY21596.1 hypothetical protein TVAG_013610 [Trichomonas vaginalis G3]KAI5489728.1 spectrin binding [Trichomonas vaginalis G3]|eukprot:XP_001582582.1 hypothetical protein [Trichomonas vaginalis G3]
MNDEIDQRLHVYDSFVKKYQDAIDIFDKLFIIKEENISEIEKLIKDVEQILFKKYKFTVKDVINAIDTAFFIRKKYLKLYWTILNLVIDKFHTDNISDYIYELVSDEFKELYRTKFEFLEYKSYDQIFHDNLPKSNIDLSILNDDLESLRSFIPPSDNEELMKTHLLEDCCFYGSVNCFYFILQNTNALINRRCLEKSFIGGNNDIINECLKYEKPTEICMANAIGSHIIENVLFLENKYGLKVDSDTASSNYNLHAFIIAIDRNIGTSKCISSCLASGIPSLSEFLIEFNADVNAKNENETIPLYSSIDRNDEETTNLLIEYGAYLNIPDEYNNLPLFHAVYENKIQSVKALLDNGIDINMRNRHGKSPIHCAACFNLTEMILFLLENGSEINSIDD